MSVYVSGVYLVCICECICLWYISGLHVCVRVHGVCMIYRASLETGFAEIAKFLGRTLWCVCVIYTSYTCGFTCVNVHVLWYIPGVYTYTYAHKGTYTCIYI